MRFKAMVGALVLCFFSVPALVGAKPLTAPEIVQKSLDYMRGKTSISDCEMTIKRPDWTRTMTIKALTQGMDNSIFWITAPAKDQGNGTLKKGNGMWMYNPKVNRVIKIPPSMMAQSWMGSDFSNDDLSKTDSIIKDYTHTIEKTTTGKDGKKVYVIKSIPHEDAPVVWGMQKSWVREDFVFLRQEFYDQNMELVKFMVCTDIKKAGDRLFPFVWKMQKALAKGEYTQIDYNSIEFDKSVPEAKFSIAALKKPEF